MSDMEKEKITLLACPFCGGEAEIVQDWIRCIKCGVWTDVPKEEDGLPKSIQAWNTRAKQVDERQNMKHDLVVYGVAIQDGEGNRIDPKDFYKADERMELDVDAVYREILNVQEEIESEHKDISLLASQRRRMAVRIVNTFKPKVEVTEDEMKLNVRQSLLGHGKLHKKYWAEPTKTQEISYGRWRQDLAEGIVEHLIQLLKDKGIL